MRKEIISNNKNKTSLGEVKGFFTSSFFIFLFSLLFAICYFACIPFEGSIEDVRDKAGVGEKGGNGTVLVSIEITSPPTKTSYNIGEALSLSGLAVTAFYDDGTSKAVTGYTHSGFDSVTAGSKTITVSFEGQTAQFTVMVEAPGKTLTTIALITSPSKTTYNIGEDLNTSNLVVRAYYSDSSENIIPINELVFTGFDSNTGGSKEVTISYGGETTSFIVTVNARTFTVTFDKNGGDTEASPASITVTEALPAPVLGSLPAKPVRKTYALKGWNTQANGSGTEFTETTTVASNITVYAQWAIDMVQVASGSFELGKELGTAGSGDVTPTSIVNLSGFYIGKYQVTQEQWQAVMEGNANGISPTPSYFHGGSGREPASGEVQVRRPVEQVSWYDVIVFCNRLSIIEGLIPAYSISDSTNPGDWGIAPTELNITWDAAIVVSGSTGYRLPTEAQWEYAAKGGASQGAYTYSGSNDPDEVAWHSGNSGSMTHEVGKKQANELGLYDMSGNVCEWCWDWFGDYTNTPKTDPVGASSGSNRVSRGGSWGHSTEIVRSAFRVTSGSIHRNSDLGFRLARP